MFRRLPAGAGGPPLTVAILDNPELVGLLAVAVAARHSRLCMIAADSALAEAWAEGLEQFQAFLRRPPLDLVAVPELRGERRSWIPENEALRAAAMSHALSGRPGVYIGSATAFASPAPLPESFVQTRFSVRCGDSASLDGLIGKLVDLDYDSEVEVSIPGEFSRRGGIVDIFSPLYEYPVRLEFFGDQVETLRFFDPRTQRSIRECREIEVVPRGERIVGESAAEACFFDYLDPETVLLVCRPRVVEEHLHQFVEPEIVGRWQCLAERWSERTIVAAPPEEVDRNRRSVVEVDWVSLAGNPGFGESLDIGAESGLLHWQILRANLQRWRELGIRVVAACGNRGEAERFREMLAADSKCRELSIEITADRLPGGVYLPGDRLAILGDREIFGKTTGSAAVVGRRRYRSNYRVGDDQALQEGELAVHAIQGIAIYHGIREIESNGLLQEVVELEFADRARLLVPLEQTWLIGRYVGGTRRPPPLSRLGGAAWKKAREAAADSACDLAAELIRLEALRKGGTGFCFREDPNWERSFAAAFPYTETPDQGRAIGEVLADMEKPEPMDRLLCGDVGYGKTEVAMRAAFRAVANGRQVAVLVPTTLLAQQHFYAFRERMAEYPVNIEMLSRFRGAGEQRKILERLAEARVDILIGTHRLLQKDVAFANLGLIVIDEEQRFGVKDKERLKGMRASVDILTMTATPIPRTLYFSLSGIRNLSTIATPPAERLPVTTVVAQRDDALVRRAIMREIERSGQVFFLHNRVRTIEAAARRLRRLVPEARMVVAHGQMASHDLEDAMRQYLRHEVDVLVCTTIIESGLDIPNANTIVVEDADRFGLAELYQLRGRVGRYHHQAYAYLLLSPRGLPVRSARLRLAAIRQYTSLGAGVNLALRDLEIRGAGNILGSQQSGHIAAVGFDFYCELLHEATARLRRESPRRGVRSVAVALPGIRFGAVGGEKHNGRRVEPAGFPAWYIESEQLRLQYYRKVANLTEESERRELVEELRDRFGALPPPVVNLLELARLRLLAAALGIFSVAIRNHRMLLETESGLWRGSGQSLPELHSREPLAQVAEIIDFLARLLENSDS